MKTIISLTLLMLFLACKNEPAKSKYFEGYVDYKVEVVALDTGRKIQQFIKMSGKSMRCYFKNGRFTKEYFDSNNISTIRFLFDDPTGRIVTINRNLSAYFFSTVDEDRNKNWKLLDSNLFITVLNKRCNRLRCSSIFTDNNQNLKSIGTFYYTTDLLLDNSNAVPRNDLFYNYWKRKYTSVTLLFTEELTGKIKTTHTATRIVATPLSDTLFTVPNDKPLIHY